MVGARDDRREGRGRGVPKLNWSSECRRASADVDPGAGERLPCVTGSILRIPGRRGQALPWETSETRRLNQRALAVFKASAVFPRRLLRSPSHPFLRREAPITSRAPAHLIRYWPEPTGPKKIHFDRSREGRARPLSTVPQLLPRLPPVPRSRMATDCFPHRNS
ncbi:hypothetical protein LZ30DRAFT_725658 [Colletotrichum cereale]|nr:hypothetical protein LZ30DRAFT_725658 [Colletotrichum cereale]